MRRRGHLTPLAIVFIALAAAAGAQDREGRPWEVIEWELTAQAATAEPYLDGLPEGGAGALRVTFTGRGGEARGRRYVVPGFWDGGRVWKVRFAPPSAGAWSFSSESRDQGLSRLQGTLRCRAWSEAEKRQNPARRGFLIVARQGPRAGRYFTYADGTPFLWVGDTWWNWTKREIRFSSFLRLVDDRAAKGFTIGQIYLPGNAGLLNERTGEPDLDLFRNAERLIAHANAKGLTVWVHPWWTRKDMNQPGTAEKIRRWWRYVVHRLAAYNVIWVLAGEYNMYNYGGMGLDFWKGLGEMIRAEDPYGRIIGAHPTPPGWQGGADAPQWSTGEILHKEPWQDYNQSQVGHGRWRNEMIPSIVAADYARKPQKPVVVTEPWYEFVNGNPTAADVRFAAWSALLSGAAGHTYGGGHVWWAHLPESPSRQGPWPLEESFEVNTLDYPGAVSIGFLARFLKNIPWWTLEPRPDLVFDYPAPYCAAVAGSRYVVFARYGGVLKLDLRPSRETDLFTYTWYDLAGNRQPAGGEIAGGAVREFHSPEDYPGSLQYKDWLLHVVKKGEAR